MVLIQPFAALRPRPELAARICELPYDVMSSDEARVVASGNPLSFLHVSKPEIDLPPETDPHADAVYTTGRENFQRLIANGSLAQDTAPAYYLYRQIMAAHSQTGLVAAASCEAYLHDLIKKHELTRPDKEDDRVRHIETLNAQTGPAFLLYRAVARLDELVADRTRLTPDVDLVAPDGVRHQAWRLGSPEDIALIDSEFRSLACLYIADGHHRSAAAARVFRTRRGTGESASFLAVIFPDDQVRILPYHRVITDLNGLTPSQFLAALSSVFTVDEAANSTPPGKYHLGLYLEGRWRGLRFRPSITAEAKGPAEDLDVALLQKHVLAPLLGIQDPRTSQRIQFVGGIRGTPELERLVDSGEHACAFSLFPTSVKDLMSISDAGGLMPPKSTWFEPKLRDGMFCHLI